jgi:CO dehydrogenase nickel-insertion accessory protein CooC1
VHLVLQGKGGIGKSVVASWLTEFLAARGQKVCAIDADPVNRSLGQYKALGAEKLDLMNQDGLIELTLRRPGGPVRYGGFDFCSR